MKPNNQRIYCYQYVKMNHNQLVSLRATILANSKLDAKKQLLLQGIMPIKITIGPRLKAGKQQETLYIVTQQIATMLQAGLPLTHTLELIAEEHHDPRWQFILSDIHQHLLTGQSLSFALSHYPTIFPMMYKEIISTGELTGQLDYCFAQLAIQLEKSIQLRKKVKKALRYPLFLLSVSFIVTLVMLLFVLPQFIQVYDSFDAELPIFTQLLINLSQGLQNNLLSLMGMISILSLFYQFIFKKKFYYQQQKYLLSVPIFGNIICLSCLTQIFQTLSMTQKTGITLLAGLLAAKRTVNNLIYQQSIQQMIHAIEKGISLSQAIMSHSYLFPTLCYQLIHIGEESGTLDLMLEKISQHYLQQTEQETDTLSQKIEPMMMMILGVIIGSLVIAMYLPIFQLGNVIH